MANYFVDPAASGANDGTSWTDAWTDLQTAADTVAAGNDIFCRGTQTLTVRIDFDTVTGGFQTPIRVVGCNSDGSADPWDDVDGTQFTLDGNSVSTNCMAGTSGKDYIKFYNIAFINATADGVSSASMDACVYWGCSFDSNGGDGFDGSNNDQGTSFVQCAFNNNTSVGCRDAPADSGVMLLCEAIGNGSNGCNVSTAGLLLLSVFHNNGFYGASTGNAGAAHLCVFDGNANVGLNMVSQSNAFFNRFTNGTTYGIAANTNVGYNAFYNNTSGEASNASTYAQANLRSSAISMAADGYNNRAGDDFTLTDAAEFRRRALNVGSYSI